LKASLKRITTWIIVKLQGFKFAFNFQFKIYFYSLYIEIIKYARDRLGDKGYNLVTENCQHFATECRYGAAQSHEVRTKNILKVQIF
jgi:hypothetical protein